MKLFNLILLIGSIQGFFLGLGLWIKNWGRKKQNPFFPLLLILMAITLLAKYSFEVELYWAYPHFWFFTDLIAYLIGPFWYFTLKNSLHTRLSLSRSDYAMLAPLLYYLGFLGYILSINSATLVQEARSLSFNRLFYVFSFTVILVNAGFMLKAQRTVRKHKSTQFPAFLVQGQNLFLGILGIWLLSFLLSVVLSGPQNIVLQLYHVAFVSLAFLCFGLAFLALIRPEAFYFLTQTYDGSETQTLASIAERVRGHLAQDKPFLQPDANLAALASAVQANPVLTSKAINRILETNFNDLINQHRVDHFLQLARESRAQQLTLWALAQEAGFNNKATFYKAFRKQMGSTPKAYLSSQKEV